MRLLGEEMLGLLLMLRLRLRCGRRVWCLHTIYRQQSVSKIVGEGYRTSINKRLVSFLSRVADVESCGVLLHG